MTRTNNNNNRRSRRTGQSRKTRTAGPPPVLHAPPLECFDPKYFHPTRNGNHNANGDITFFPPSPPPPLLQPNSTFFQRNNHDPRAVNSNSNVNAQSGRTSHVATSGRSSSNHSHHSYQNKQPSHFHNHLSECYYTDGSDNDEEEVMETKKPSKIQNPPPRTKKKAMPPCAALSPLAHNHNHNTTSSNNDTNATNERETMKISPRSIGTTSSSHRNPTATSTVSSFPSGKNNNKDNYNNKENDDEDSKPTFWTTYNTTTKSLKNPSTKLPTTNTSNNKKQSNNTNNIRSSLSSHHHQSNDAQKRISRMTREQEKQEQQESDAIAAIMSVGIISSSDEEENDNIQKDKTKPNSRISQVSHYISDDVEHDHDNERPSLWYQVDESQNHDGTTTTTTATTTTGTNRPKPTSTKSGSSTTTTRSNNSGDMVAHKLPPPPPTYSPAFSLSLEKSRREKERQMMQQRPMLFRDDHISSSSINPTPTSIVATLPTAVNSSTSAGSYYDQNSKRSPFSTTANATASSTTAATIITPPSSSPMPSMTSLKEQVSTDIKGSQYSTKSTAAANSNNNIIRSLSSLNFFPTDGVDHEETNVGDHNSFGNDDDLELQVGTVLPGAFAIEGLEAHRDTGYDSGFEDDNTHYENNHDQDQQRHNPPSQTDQTNHHHHVASTRSGMMAPDTDEISQISAEIVEELQICDGQIVLLNEQDDDDHDKNKTMSKRRMVCVFLCSCIVVVTIVVSVIKVGNSSSGGTINASITNGTGTTTPIDNTPLKPTQWVLMGNKKLEAEGIRTTDMIGSTTTNTEEDRLYFGQSISFSGDGNRIIVGIPGWDNGIEKHLQGKAQIHYWNDQDQRWILHQELIDGPSSGAQAGTAVTISKDGNSVAVSAPYHYGLLGQVTVYEESTTRQPQKQPLPSATSSIHDPSTQNITTTNSSSISTKQTAKSNHGSNNGGDGDWSRVGPEITGSSSQLGAFGRSITLSGDGTILAIVQSSSDSRKNGHKCGPVQVFHRQHHQQQSDNEEIITALSSDENSYNIGHDTNKDHNQGNDPENDENGWKLYGRHPIVDPIENFCTTSLSLSANGRYLALASVDADTNFKGYVRTYMLQDDNTFIWKQIGQVLEGYNEDVRFGESLSLSDDGRRLAIGAPGLYTRGEGGAGHLSSQGGGDTSHGSDGGGGGTWGYASIYQYEEASTTWGRIGEDLIGKNPSDLFGFSVSLSGNGDFVAVGAPGVNKNAGQVSVYKLGDNSDDKNASSETSANLWVEVGGGGIGYGYESSNVGQGDQFGSSVSMSSDGRRVAVGAPQTSYDQKLFQVGSVGIYKLATET